MSLRDDLIRINDALSSTLQGINSLLPFEAETLKDAPPIIEVAIGSARQEGEESGYGIGYDVGYGNAASIIVSTSNEVIEKYTTPVEDWSELPSKIDEVYGVGVHDGKISLLESSKYMRGVASGELVSFNDVSPVEHEVSVKVSDQAAKVRVFGKNLFDRKKLVELGGVEQEDGSIYFEKNPASNPTVFEVVGNVGRVTLSYNLKTLNESGSSGARFQCRYTDGNVDYIGVKNSLEYTKIVWTSNASKVVEKITIDYGTIYNSTWLKNVQLELGTTATEYEPYKGEEYEQGEPIASISPNMTVTTDTDGALVSVEYLRDIDLYIDSLITGVALSGGE